MDIVTMSVKVNKTKKYKVLFVKINISYFTSTKENLVKIINEYTQLLKDNKGIMIIFDIRMVENTDKKLVWEVAPLMSTQELNNIARQNIKSVAIISNSKIIINLIKVISKVHPFVIPVQFVENNDEAIKFIERYI